MLITFTLLHFFLSPYYSLSSKILYDLFIDLTIVILFPKNVNSSKTMIHCLFFLTDISKIPERCLAHSKHPINMFAFIKSNNLQIFILLSVLQNVRVFVLKQNVIFSVSIHQLSKESHFSSKICLFL